MFVFVFCHPPHLECLLDEGVEVVCVFPTFQLVVMCISSKSIWSPSVCVLQTQLVSKCVFIKSI